MTNSVDPDPTAPIGAVLSGSTLFASILKLVSNVRLLFATDNFSRRHFSDAFFLGAFRVLIKRPLPSRSHCCLLNQGSQIRSQASPSLFYEDFKLVNKSAC